MAYETPGKMYALATILTILALVAVILRLYARRRKKARLSWDDYFIILAFLFTLAIAICMYIGSALGDLARHTQTKPGKHHLLPVFTHRTEVFLQVEYAVLVATPLALGFTKISVLMFYKRIFRGKFFEISVWANIALVSIWTAGFFFSNVFQCWPIDVNWIGWGNAIGKCLDVNKMFIVQAYTDVFSDVLILTLPIPNTWTLHVPVRHKVAISLIFLLGALTVCTGIAKLVVFYDVVAATQDILTTDVTYISTPIVYWSMVEAALGVVGACLPLMRPLVAGSSPTGFIRSLRSIMFASFTPSGNSDSKGSNSAGTRHINSQQRRQANEERMTAALEVDAWKRFGSEDRTLFGSAQASPVKDPGTKVVQIPSPVFPKSGSPRDVNRIDEGDLKLEVNGLPVTPFGDLEKQLPPVPVSPSGETKKQSSWYLSPHGRR